MKNISARLTSVINGMCDADKADKLVTNVCIYIGKLKHNELTSDQFWFLVHRELAEAIPDKDNRDAIVSQFELEILRTIGLQNDVRRLSNLQRFRYARPRLWAAVAFLPIVLITIIVLPVSILYEFIHECPSFFYSVWCYVSSFCCDVFSSCIEVVSEGWAIWWDAVHGNRSLKKQIKLAGRQVGKTYVNAEMAKRVSFED